jgi:hypothetical protein
MRHGILLVVTLAAASACPLPSRAQVSSGAFPPAPDAVEVGRLLRHGGYPGGAVDVLTQQAGHASDAERDAMADTLVAVILSEEPREVKQRAMSALLDAAMGTGSGGAAGIPYQGAAERMYRVALAGVWWSAGAAGSFVLLPDTAQALHYLRLLATSDASAAHRAVAALGNEMGARGLAVARELFDQDAVRTRTARKALSGIADARGWKRPEL